MGGPCAAGLTGSEAVSIKEHHCGGLGWNQNYTRSNTKGGRNKEQENGMGLGMGMGKEKDPALILNWFIGKSIAPLPSPYMDVGLVMPRGAVPPMYSYKSVLSLTRPDTLRLTQTRPHSTWPYMAARATLRLGLMYATGSGSNSITCGGRQGSSLAPCWAHHEAQQLLTCRRSGLRRHRFRTW